MTGYGQARGGKLPVRWHIEIRTWNHRFFEFTSRLPNVLLSFEGKIRDIIRDRVKRGKISISVALKNGNDAQDHLTLDEKKVAFYLRNIQKIQKKFCLEGKMNVNTLLAIPNVFVSQTRENDSEALWNGFKGVLDGTLRNLVRSREKEGLALVRDFDKRLDLITGSVDRIQKETVKTAEKQFVRLKDKISELIGNAAIDEKRIEHEVAMMAERMDVTEEIVRLGNHLKHFHSLIRRGNEVGKELDFIAQEMNREVNTIGSKSQDSAISADVIRIKSEIEKIREQVQNVE
ncbi:MAG: YicC family protein [Omnitrophica bacterium RIFCSPLOWO2_12_FULL_44_17]|uniref:YicC family protein n=1 Tax=Candidatus Danuiimicrobium aquiferis TaxID=1801832 RepID=A0A1G1KSN9_9BACT|nr:MAG: YicC family protein [Omnitrophica bacterium RIFCSPHIGHO2_02_FULL_45_28]OGW91885.1 MAG: YicC family protein [Omnitrophica bacterium RIFCSPHIGHO2_12_FULL_44_12]OGW95589.1 MAG: YicC family protein [Omnitrophica bacterium RIFCSPLOWO2_12_FULL_44_17]OGX03696.1 MAG: YicC family protein [Omnitrophica bacterium RIFCSPLOWO2_02_FULL_44_11]